MDLPSQTPQAPVNPEVSQPSETPAPQTTSEKFPSFADALADPLYGALDQTGKLEYLKNYRDKRLRTGVEQGWLSKAGLERFNQAYYREFATVTNGQAPRDPDVIVNTLESARLQKDEDRKDLADAETWYKTKDDSLKANVADPDNLEALAAVITGKQDKDTVVYGGKVFAPQKLFELPKEEFAKKVHQTPGATNESKARLLAAYDDYKENGVSPYSPVDPGFIGDDAGYAYRDVITQTPQGIMGLAGLIGDALERVTGKGASLRDWGYQGFLDWEKKTEPGHKSTFEFDPMMERVKKGDMGALGDFLEYWSGYGVAQFLTLGATTLATGPAGAAVTGAAGPAANVLLPAFLKNAFRKRVNAWIEKQALKKAKGEVITQLAAKEGIRKGTPEGVKRLEQAMQSKAFRDRLTSEEFRKGVVRDIGARIGNVGASAASVAPLQYGSIYATNRRLAEEEGREMTDKEIGRNIFWGTVTTIPDMVGDILGLDLLQGRFASRLPRNRAVAGAAAAGIAMPLESGTEWFQTLGERIGAGQSTNDAEAWSEYRTAMAGAPLGAGPVAFAGGVIHGHPAVNAKAEVAKKEFQSAPEQAIAAKNEAAGSPEVAKALLEVTANDISQRALNPEENATEGQAAEGPSLMSMEGRRVTWKTPDGPVTGVLSAEDGEDYLVITQDDGTMVPTTISADYDTKLATAKDAGIEPAPEMEVAPMVDTNATDTAKESGENAIVTEPAAPQTEAQETPSTEPAAQTEQAATETPDEPTPAPQEAPTSTVNEAEKKTGADLVIAAPTGEATKVEGRGADALFPKTEATAEEASQPTAERKPSASEVAQEPAPAEPEEESSTVQVEGIVADVLFPNRKPDESKAVRIARINAALKKGGLKPYEVNILKKGLADLGYKTPVETKPESAPEAETDAEAMARNLAAIANAPAEDPRVRARMEALQHLNTPDASPAGRRAFNNGGGDIAETAKALAQYMEQETTPEGRAAAKNDLMKIPGVTEIPVAQNVEFSGEAGYVSADQKDQLFGPSKKDGKTIPGDRADIVAPGYKIQDAVILPAKAKRAQNAQTKIPQPQENPQTTNPAVQSTAKPAPSYNLDEVVREAAQTVGVRGEGTTQEIHQQAIAAIEAIKTAEQEGWEQNYRDAARDYAELLLGGFDFTKPGAPGNREVVALIKEVPGVTVAEAADGTVQARGTVTGYDGRYQSAAPGERAFRGANQMVTLLNDALQMPGAPSLLKAYVIDAGVTRWENATKRHLVQTQLLNDALETPDTTLNDKGRRQVAVTRKQMVELMRQRWPDREEVFDQDVSDEVDTFLKRYKLQERSDGTYVLVDGMKPDRRAWRGADATGVNAATPEQAARHAELEAEHNAGTITPEETAEAQGIVDAVAKRNGGILAQRGGSVIREAFHTAKEKRNANDPNEKTYNERGFQAFFDISKAGYIAEEWDAGMGETQSFYLFPRLTFDYRNADHVERLMSLIDVALLPAAFRQQDALRKAIQKGYYGVLEQLVPEMKRAGFDSAYMTEFAVDEFGEPDTIAIYNPNAAKLSTPFTGKPLAQRFDLESNSIRNADTTKQSSFALPELLLRSAKTVRDAVALFASRPNPFQELARAILRSGHPLTARFEITDDIPGNVPGGYNPATHHVKVHSRAGNRTLFHEVGHSVMERTLQLMAPDLVALESRPAGYRKLIERIAGDSKRDPLIREWARIFMEAAKAEGHLDKIGTTEASGDTYGYRTLSEFTAEAFSNQAFQNRMRAIADPDRRGNLWDSIVEWVRKFFKLPSKTRTLLDSIMQATGETIAADSTLPDRVFDEQGNYLGPVRNAQPPTPDYRLATRAVAYLASNPSQDWKAFEETMGRETDPETVRSFIEAVQAEGYSHAEAHREGQRNRAIRNAWARKLAGQGVTNAEILRTLNEAGLPIPAKDLQGIVDGVTTQAMPAAQVDRSKPNAREVLGLETSANELANVQTSEEFEQLVLRRRQEASKANAPQSDPANPNPDVFHRAFARLKAKNRVSTFWISDIIKETGLPMPVVQQWLLDSEQTGLGRLGDAGLAEENYKPEHLAAQFDISATRKAAHFSYLGNPVNVYTVHNFKALDASVNSIPTDTLVALDAEAKVVDASNRVLKPLTDAAGMGLTFDADVGTQVIPGTDGRPLVMNVNPRKLAEWDVGTPQAFDELLERVFREELDHVDGMIGVKWQDIVALIDSMSEGEILKIAEGYYSAAATPQRIALVADMMGRVMQEPTTAEEERARRDARWQIGSEYLRMIKQKVESGYTTESVMLDIQNGRPSGVLETIKRYLQRLLTRWQTRFQLMRDPALARMIQDMQEVQRMLEGRAREISRGETKFDPAMVPGPMDERTGRTLTEPQYPGQTMPENNIPDMTMPEMGPVLAAPPTHIVSLLGVEKGTMAYAYLNRRQGKLDTRKVKNAADLERMAGVEFERRSRQIYEVDPEKIRSLEPIIRKAAETQAKFGVAEGRKTLDLLNKPLPNIPAELRTWIAENYQLQKVDAITEADLKLIKTQLAGKFLTDRGRRNYWDALRRQAEQIKWDGGWAAWVEQNVNRPRREAVEKWAQHLSQRVDPDWVEELREKPNRTEQEQARLDAFSQNWERQQTGALDPYQQNLAWDILERSMLGDAKDVNHPNARWENHGLGRPRDLESDILSRTLAAIKDGQTGIPMKLYDEERAKAATKGLTTKKADDGFRWVFVPGARSSGNPMNSELRQLHERIGKFIENTNGAETDGESWVRKWESENGKVDQEIRGRLVQALDVGLNDFGDDVEQRVNAILDAQAAPQIDIDPELRKYLEWDLQGPAHGEIPINETQWNDVLRTLRTNSIKAHESGTPEDMQRFDHLWGAARNAVEELQKLPQEKRGIDPVKTLMALSPNTWCTRAEGMARQYLGTQGRRGQGVDYWLLLPPNGTQSIGGIRLESGTKEFEGINGANNGGDIGELLASHAKKILKLAQDEGITGLDTRVEQAAGTSRSLATSANEIGSPVSRQQRIPFWARGFDWKTGRLKTGRYQAGGKLTAAGPFDIRVFRLKETANNKVSAAARRAEYFAADIKRLMKQHPTVTHDTINTAIGNTDNSLSDQDIVDLENMERTGLRNIQQNFRTAMQGMVPLRRRVKANHHDYRSLMLLQQGIRAAEQTRDVALKDLKDTMALEEGARKQARKDAARIAQAQARASLPPPVREVVQKFSDQLAILQLELWGTGALAPNMRATFAANWDMWLHRSYAIFDTPKWVDWLQGNLGSIPAVIRAAAAATPGANLPENVRIVRAALDRVRVELTRRLAQAGMKKGQSMAQATANAQAHYADPAHFDEISNYLEDLMKIADGDVRSFLQGSWQGKKPIEHLMERGNIPEEFRELWGEHKNASVNAIKSLSLLAGHLANHQFLTDLRDLGVSEGWISTTRAGKNDNDVVLVTESDANPKWTPLAGCWGPPMLRDALKGSMDSRNLHPAHRALLTLTGAAMAAKTVLYWAGGVRNFGGNIAPAASNNWVRPYEKAWRSDFGNAFKAVYYDIFMRGTKHPTVNSVSAALREDMLELYAYGLADDSNVTGVLKELMGPGILDRELATVEGRLAVAERLSRRTFNWLGQSLKASFQTAAKVYQGFDTVWKFVAFKTEIRLRQEVYGNTKSLDEIKAEAAEAVKKGLPSYSRSTEVIKAIRRVPVTAPFVTFTGAVYNIIAGTFQTGMNDIVTGRETGNKALEEHGIWRLFSFVSTMSLVASLPIMGRMILSALDPDDPFDQDDDDALRQHTPDWEKNAGLIPLRRDKETNEVKYFNLTFSNLYDVVMRPFRSLGRDIRGGAGVTETLRNFAWESLDPLPKEQIFLGSMMDAARGVDSSGKTVWTQNQTREEKIAAGLQHIWKAAYEPGTIRSVTDFDKAVRGVVSKQGKAYDVTQTLLSGLLGLKVQSTNVSTTLGYAGNAFRLNVRDAAYVFTQKFNSEGTVTDDELRDSYIEANKQFLEAYRKLAMKADAARKLLHMTDQEIALNLEAKGVQRVHVANILANIYPRYEPSKKTIDKARALDAKERKIPQNRIALLNEFRSLVPDYQPILQK